MSLETAIEENTKAVRDLIATLAAGAGTQAAIGKAKETAGNAKPAATAGAATQATAAASAVQETKAATSAEPVGYDAVKGPFVALWKKDMAKATAILGEYGVDNLKLVAADKLGEVKVKIEAALA